MRRTVRFAVLGLALAFAVVLPSLIGSTASSPYLSALSSVVVSETAAAPRPCEFKGCAGGSRHNIVCAKTPGFALKCTILSGGFCSDQNC